MQSIHQRLHPVYIVDDDEAVRSGFSRLLRSAGLEPRPFGSSTQFLEEVRTIHGACILLDITMPGMTGLEVQEQLAARHIDLPVIAVSAHDDDATRMLAHRAGACLFLRKPVDDQALLDAISWVTRSSA